MSVCGKERKCTGVRVTLQRDVYGDGTHLQGSGGCGGWAWRRGRVGVAVQTNSDHINKWPCLWSGHGWFCSLSRNTVTSARTILDDIGNMFDDLADQLDAMLD